MTINYTTYVILAIAVGITHSLLNFKLCGTLSEKPRFHRATIYFVAIFNGGIAPLVINIPTETQVTPYIVFTIVLCAEVALLFKGSFSQIFGFAAGSLLHLFVLRAIVIASMSIAYEVSMYEIVSKYSTVYLVNLGSFALQIMTIALFILLIPLDLVKTIMKDKGFYLSLLSLAIVLDSFLLFNTYMFTEDTMSINLAVQEIGMVVCVLLFFYIMLIFMIRIFSLGIYKEKNKELEGEIDKNKTLTTAVFSFAEILIENNCTKDKISRVVVNSVDSPTEHLPTLEQFFKYQVDAFTYPDDGHLFSDMTSQMLVEKYNNNNREIVIEYRAKRIVLSGTPLAVKSVGDDYYWFKLLITLVKAANSDDIIALFTIDEIHDEKQEELALRRKAEHDPLTGGYNKAAFMSKVTNHLEKGGRGALFMLDLDNFKGINDNMGHSVGDDVLCEIYAKIASVFRPTDIVSRIGGDEYVVFLIDTSSQNIINEKAELLCKTVHKTYHALNGVDIEISCSVGVAISPDSGKDYTTLFKAADLAMYNSKNKGKNSYTIHDANLLSGFKPQEKEAYTRNARMHDHNIED